MKLFLAICITAITALAIPAFCQQQLTLEAAIQVALENNYTIKIARNEEEITANNLTRGNAGFLPSVVADYDKSYGVETFEQTSGDGNLRTARGAQSNRESYGATLNWTIFDGLRMFTTYEQLEILNQQSEEMLRAEIERLVYDISSAFYSAALEKERLALFESNVALSEERLQVAEDRYDLGKASKLEFLQAQVDLNADKSSRIQQLELLAVRKLELMRLMAVENDSLNFVIDYTLEKDLGMTLPELLAQVESQNAQLLALRREQEIAEHTEKIIKSERLPEVDLFADYTHSNSRSPSGYFTTGQSDDLIYGLSARWTLFNGFNVKRRLKNARIQQETAKYQYQDQLSSYTTNIKRRYINYTNNLDLLRLEEENLSVARENNEIAQERYEIGLSNSLELRESQLNLINAEIRRQDAAFATKQAEIALKYLSGLLVER